MKVKFKIKKLGSNATIPEYLERLTLFWKIAFGTLALDWLVLLSPNLNIPKQQNDLTVLIIILIVALITTKHRLILRAILFTKWIEKFINEHRISAAAAIITISTFISACLLCYQKYIRHIPNKTVFFQAFLCFSTILSLYFTFIKAKSTVKKESSSIIQLDQVYYICIGRIAIPRFLSFWAALAFISGAISQLNFYTFAILAFILVNNAYPRRSNFVTKCRSCSKEIFYGSGRFGCCDECAPTVYKPPKKFKLPKKISPYQKTPHYDPKKSAQNGSKKDSLISKMKKLSALKNKISNTVKKIITAEQEEKK